MIKTFALAMSVCSLASTAAFAQNNLAATLAPAEEEFGQSIGQAAFAGPSIFVTASGRAKLPAPIADTYYVTVESKNASAVAAARDRDAKVAQLQAVAKHLGVDLQLGETGISLEIDTDAQQRLITERNARRQAQSTQPPPLPFIVQSTVGTPKIFVAKSSLKFGALSNAATPAFFDAIHAAGVDNISHGLPQQTNAFMPTSNFMGFGSIATLDDNFWAAASEEAFRSAHAQAQALAAASGRSLGPARQIIVLSRTAEGVEAVESLAVRFGLIEPAH
jgi:uncharacterized protein YggE